VFPLPLAATFLVHIFGHIGLHEMGVVQEFDTVCSRRVNVTESDTNFWSIVSAYVLGVDTVLKKNETPNFPKEAVVIERVFEF